MTGRNKLPTRRAGASPLKQAWNRCSIPETRGPKLASMKLAVTSALGTAVSLPFCRPTRSNTYSLNWSDLPCDTVLSGHELYSCTPSGILSYTSQSHVSYYAAVLHRELCFQGYRMSQIFDWALCPVKVPVQIPRTGGMKRACFAGSSRRGAPKRFDLQACGVENPEYPTAIMLAWIAASVASVE